MAALIRHASQQTSRKYIAVLRDLITGGKTAPLRRDYATARDNRKKYEKKPVKVRTVTGPTLEAARTSLASRGYLRSQKSYLPADDVMERMDKIFEKEGLELSNETRLDEPILRFKLFAACSEEFNHTIPNSLLHTLETVGNLRKFYLTPVDAIVPLDAMREKNLPKNLHIRYEYHRFHPETDTMFGGKTAFPKSSTLVTGLKYKKKYPGHLAKTSWP